MGDEMLRPAEVCKRLGMPPSTLRIYSTKFSELLSESARKPAVIGEGRTGYRLYTSRDLLVLSRAKELLAQGLTYDQALAELRLAVPGAVGGRRRGVEEAAGRAERVVGGAVGEDAMAGFVEVLREALASGEKAWEASRALQERQEREIETLRRRLEKVEETLRDLTGELERKGEVEKGWRRRFFGG